MTTVSPSSRIVSLRSTLQKPESVHSEKRIDLVRIKSGEIVPASVLSLKMKLLNRQCEYYSMSLEPLTLVFRDTLNIHGLAVTYKLTMKAEIVNSAADRFIRAFYRPDVRFITTGFLIKLLHRSIRDQVAENLSFVNVAKVHGVVKSAARHNKIAEVLEKCGLRCLYDELKLESVA